MTVISNTTPFISLCSVHLLHLMPAVFGSVVVAPSVVQECGEGGRIGVPDLTRLPWVSVQTVPTDRMLPPLFDLDRGERDTLLLAIRHKDAWVVMDERIGRNMAEYLGLRVTGTLGLLAKARAMGLVPSFREAAQAMRNEGIYYSPALIQRIAARLNETDAN